jgi:predicted dehydrogenase
MTPRRTPITRRQFVASAAAAAVAPTVLTNVSLAQTSANQKLGIAWIGAGKRGRTVMQNYFLRDDRFRCVGIAEVDKTRRDYNAAFVNRINKSNDCFTTPDYRELLERKDVDVAVIATPDHWHTIPAMHAALAGKHVYCEKPLTLNIHESELIIKAARKTGVKFQTGSQQRTEFGGKFITACEYVLNGRIGKCDFVEVSTGDPAVPCDLPGEEMEPGLDWDRWLGPAPKRPYNSILSPRGVHSHFPKWRLYEEYAGGILADLGAHMFDIAQWGLAKDRESPVTIVPPTDDKAIRGTKMIYADGKTIQHIGGRGHSVTFLGEHGKIYVDRGRVTSEPASILEEPLTDSDLKLPRTKGNHGTNFANAIGTDTQPICDVEVGSRTAVLCHLANISYDVRETLTYDPNRWKFAGSEAANKRLDYAERRAGYELPKID